MSEPTDGSGWPMVSAGVPSAIEVLHPGYAIAPFTGFAVPGLSLFVIHGGERRSGAPERYASVEAVDYAGAVLTGRALFVRAAATTASAGVLARYAMAMLLRRAEEQAAACGGDGAEPAGGGGGGCATGGGWGAALLGEGAHRVALRERGGGGACDGGASR